MEDIDKNSVKSNERKVSSKDVNSFCIEKIFCYELKNVSVFAFICVN